MPFSPSSSGGPANAGQQSDHVILVVEENNSFERVVGNPQMPFLNDMISRYGLAVQYFANEHHSIPNYFWLTAGQQVTADDSTLKTFAVDNLATHLRNAGKSWKSYAESLPFAGYTGFNVYPYVKRHNPFAYFQDVIQGPEVNNIVPFSQFSADAATGQLPNFSFVVPNLLDDAHDGTLAEADRWLIQNIQPVLSSPAFQAGGNGILIITFDESFDEDCRPSPSCDANLFEFGGRVSTVVIGPNVLRGNSSTRYMHENLLKTISVALGLGSSPGNAASAANMNEFFK
jgi:hypothetical protein